MEILLAFLDGLRSEDMDEARARMTRATRAMGYDGFTYAGARATETRHMAPVPLKSEVLYLTDFSNGWPQHYMENRYTEADPRLRVALTQSTPVVWGPDFLAGERSTAEDAMMRDACAWGMRHGLCVAVTACDGARALVAVSAAEPVAAGPLAVHEFHLIALHLHEALRPLLVPREPLTARLSRRELDVLMWSAEGKTAADIGHILEISPRTVSAHLTSAMRKLGVYSKTHAVAKFLTGAW